MPLIDLGMAAVAVDSFLRDLPRWPLLGLLAYWFFWKRRNAKV